MGLAYAVSDRGACHLHAWTAGEEMLGWDGKDPKATKGKAADVKEATEVTNAAWDSSGLCRFAGFALDKKDVHRMIVAATGFDYRLDDFVQIGERINNLAMMFNLREGFTSKDDTLPRRLLKESMPTGPCKGQTVRLDEMLPEYYRLCGWDENGRPTKDKLRELGLEFTLT
jgi:aldehyde:ferredoxin oxidoreductase